MTNDQRIVECALQLKKQFDEDAGAMWAVVRKVAILTNDNGMGILVSTPAHPVRSLCAGSLSSMDE